jgi:aminoglycoside phosphotransferase (APT) family kinase protein
MPSRPAAPTEADEVADASSVRTEDAFDIDRLCTWLGEHDLGLTARPEVLQFSGGASNLTYLLRFPHQDLILRRPPGGHKSSGAHDMSREYRIQHALRPVFDYVPRTVGLCEDTEVIGTPFYVMERIPGHIPRQEFPAEMSLTATETTDLCTGALDVLIDLHQLDPASAKLDWLFKGEGYVGRQLRGWSERYRQAKTPDVGDLETVMTWLADNQPTDDRSCLIHNDFRFDNIVFDRNHPHAPVGLLDWEMATVGHPLMDLGGALAYWIEADDEPEMHQFRRQPTHVAGMLTRSEVVDYYCRRMGIGLTDREWGFYEIFGLFRTAAIAQQIYYRYYHGQTTNPAFQSFGVLSAQMERLCRSMIRRYQ